jgi:hypothetical protein
VQEVKHLEEALQQLRQRAAELRPAPSVSQRSTTRSPVDEQQALEAIHNQAAGAVLALHTHLQTHLTLEEIQHAQALMRELDAVLVGESRGDLEQRIRAAVINRLVKECAPLAWHTLLTLMERAQVSWPEPPGLSLHDDARAVQFARERELAELEETFLASSLERSADLALGVVEIWKARYPSPDSPSWQRMVLQGVGCGILGSLFSVAVATLGGDRGDFVDFITRVEQLLHEELVAIQKILQAGVYSTTDADALIVNIIQLCQEVVPTMAWETVAPEVHQALQQFNV